MMKTKLMALVAAIAVSLGAWAEPTVTDITAKQRYPWNGLVDISCTVSGIAGTVSGYEFAVVAVDKDTGKEYTATHFSIAQGGANIFNGDALSNGSYALLWNARLDLGQVIVERMFLRVTLEPLGISAGKVQLWAGGPYWADRNIGASSPEDSGLYFWWGDTTGHRPSGTTFSFSFSSSNTPTYNKSPATLQSEGWVVSKNGTYVLAPAHDAAHVKWGGSWRMPTYQELYDLCYTYCDWTWTTRNGVKGYIVRGRGSYAAKSIFLPASGYGYGTSLYSSGSYGRCWSSVPDSDYYDSTYLYFYSSGTHSASNYYRYFGFPVRPVQGSTN